MTEKYVLQVMENDGDLLPLNLTEEGVIYEETWLDQPAMLIFACPCGCKLVFQIPIAPKGEVLSNGKGGHHWTWERDTQTLCPSVRHKAGCLSHFSITNGNVEWH